MINFDDVTNKNIKEDNPNWPQIVDHPHRILIIGGPRSGKTNSLLNLISQQPDIDEIYLFTKDPFEAKYQFLINKRDSTGLKDLNDSKAFIEYSNDMDGIYKNIEEYIPNKQLKILIHFGDMIADMPSHKKLNPIVTELFVKGRKPNISLLFIRQSYFFCQKTLDQKPHSILLWKFQTKENFNIII